MSALGNDAHLDKKGLQNNDNIVVIGKNIDGASAATRWSERKTFKSIEIYAEIGKPSVDNGDVLLFGI